ncbi:hypothetical protein BX600DRAFT_528362 [Xylariales sp. PMI_506]|nr:hypothetical protein BX600DRAFT_528362 [Xylariales sp. PMI_506]
MKLTSLLSLSAVYSLATAVVIVNECTVTSDTTTDESSYFFTLGILSNQGLNTTTGICAACNPTLVAEAAALNITLESFQCLDTIGDALFILTYDNTGGVPPPGGFPGFPLSTLAYQLGMENCGIEFAACPLPPADPFEC